MAGEKPPDFHRLALGLVLCTDATVGDDGSVIGDPTEAAFVVLAAKMGVDAEQTRESLPRRAEVPFDPGTSSWPPSTTAPTGWAAWSSGNRTSPA